MTSVAISREMGSGDYEIGAAVAKEQDFTYVNRQMLLEAAQVYGVPVATHLDVVERRPRLWDRFDVERHRYLTCLEAASYTFAERGDLVTASRNRPIYRGTRPLTYLTRNGDVGHLVTIADPLGRTTTRTYDGISRFVTQTDPLGRLTWVSR